MVTCSDASCNYISSSLLTVRKPGKQLASPNSKLRCFTINEKKKLFSFYIKLVQSLTHTNEYYIITNKHSLASWQLLFPPFLLPILLLSPLHKVLDIFSQSDGLYHSAYHCAYSRLYQLVEGGLRVPVAPNGRAVSLLKLLLTGIGPGEGWHLHVG